MARLAKPKAEQPGQVIRRINASLALLLSGGANETVEKVYKLIKKIQNKVIIANKYFNLLYLI
jgi:D-Tyr-tRNAtyr deacylase